MDGSDITLAIRIDDLTLLESVFHTDAPVGEGAPLTRLSITNPQHDFAFDEKSQRTTLQAMVNVQFGMAGIPPKEAAVLGDGADPVEFLHFGLVAGVAASVAKVGDAVASARHMAGGESDAEAQRDRNTQHALRLEAIKATYALATSRLAEASSLSPLGRVVLPPIDADALLLELEREG